MNIVLVSFQVLLIFLFKELGIGTPESPQPEPGLRMGSPLLKILQSVLRLTLTARHVLGLTQGFGLLPERLTAS